MKRFFRLILVILTLALSTMLLATSTMQRIYAQVGSPAQNDNPNLSNGRGTPPLMGWGSWSTEASYGTNYLTAQNLMNQSDYMKQKGLQAAGYNEINIDSGWWMTTAWQGGGIAGDHYDGNGIPTPDTGRFPNGLQAVISHITGNGQKVGLYYVIGLPKVVYNANPPILGTSCHAQDIAVQPLTSTNGWGDHWAINWNNSCAQAYINSVANSFKSYGISFLKIDGVTDANQNDVKAWATALSGSGIWIELSWSLDRTYISVWQANANSARIDNDVECYCGSGSLVKWGNVAARFTDAPAWTGFFNANWKNEFDSLDIGNGSNGGVRSGLTTDERQTNMTLWAIENSPLIMGDDIYFDDSYGLSLLTNSEVIAQDQTGTPATPLSQSSNQQVWRTKNADGTYTVALFNLDSSTTFTVTVNWSSLGFNSSAAVHDMWSKTDLGNFSTGWSASIPPHGSRLIKVTPGTLATNTPAPETPYGGTRAPIPGKIEVENYDNGGEGVAYHDSDTANQGGQYRTGDGVDIENTTDTGAGYDVGYSVSGEWLKYSVNVTTSGTYNIDFRVASTSASSFHLEVDGTNVTGTMTLPNTGGWQTYTTVTKSGVSLAAGNHVLRLYEEATNGNYNWINFSLASSATNTPTFVPPSATPGATKTNTPVGATNTPTFVPPTATTAGPTNTPSSGTCSPVNATITAPVTFDGAGTLCWKSNNLGSYINSWNLDKLTVNGVVVTNIYVASGSLPAKASDGYWYISYSSSVSWGHFEAK